MTTTLACEVAQRKTDASLKHFRVPVIVSRSLIIVILSFCFFFTKHEFRNNNLAAKLLFEIFRQPAIRFVQDLDGDIRLIAPELSYDSTLYFKENKYEVYQIPQSSLLQ